MPSNLNCSSLITIDSLALIKLKGLGEKKKRENAGKAIVKFDGVVS